MSEQVPLSELIARARPPAHEAHQPIAFSDRAKLFLTGIPLFSLLIVGASLYWLLYIWDFKGMEKRTRHYRLKLSNTFMTHFRPGTVARWEAWRENECAHCGACCEILWRCPFLKESAEGVSSCSVHSKRPLACRTFPIDPWSVKMISEKDRLCSYEFTDSSSSAQNQDQSS